MQKQYFSAFTKAPVLVAALLLGLALPLLSLPEITKADMNNTRADAFGYDEYSGSSWFGGAGADVYSNGSSAALHSPVTDNSANGVTTGHEWQCVELFNRVYALKGWITSRWAGDGNTLKDLSPLPAGFSVEGYTAVTYINPGDAITFTDGAQPDHSGHVVMVDSVSGSGTTKTVNVVSQNTQGVLWTVSWNTSTQTLTQTYLGTSYSPQAIIHRPNATGSRSAAVTRSSGDMDVFYRNTSAQLMNQGWNSSTGWNTPTARASSGVSSNPTAVARTSSSMDVFYRDTSNNLVNVGWSSGGGWGSPATLINNGTIQGDPYVVARDSNHMDVFYKSTSNGLMDAQWDSTNGWQSPLIISSTTAIASSPVAISRTTDSMDIFYRDSSNNLKNVGYYQGSWSGPNTRVSSTVYGDLTIITRTSQSMDVFYQTTSGGLGNAYWNSTNGWGSNTWSGSAVIASTSASFVGTPKAINRDDGNMQVFYQDSYGNLVEKAWNWQTGWASPYNRASDIENNPTGVSRSSGSLDMFFRNGGGLLKDTLWDVNAGWSEGAPGAGGMA
jgi:hypothetical protein